MAVSVRDAQLRVFRWVDDPDREEVPCGMCGGVFKPLRVEPLRSESYVLRIHMCDGCKTVIPEGEGRRIEP